MWTMTDDVKVAAGRGDRTAWLLARADRLQRENYDGTNIALGREWHTIAEILLAQHGIDIYVYD